MVRLLDGPAAGIYLELARAPLLLRVTRNGRGQWDALDQLGDKPDLVEEVFVYRRQEGKAGWAHLYFGGGKGRTIATATYRLYPDQPLPHTMRTTDLWREWCLATAATWEKR